MPVEKIVEVEVEVRVEKPVYQEILKEEEVLLETEVVDVIEQGETVENVEHDDPELAREIQIRRRELESQKAENGTLRS